MNNINKFSVPRFAVDIEKSNGECNLVTNSGMVVPVLIKRIDVDNRGFCYDELDTIDVVCTVIHGSTESKGTVKAKDVKKMTTGSVNIKKVIFSGPATIVIWSDGQKSVVKAQDGEPFDPEKGLALAIAKRALGNNYHYYDTIKKWVKKADS